MRNKKQAYEQLTSVIHWNTSRGNDASSLDWDLEAMMLQEELDELKVATKDVDHLDALLDLKFVVDGALGKLLRSPQVITDAYELVITANSKKSSYKNTLGKIQKPANFEGPEAELQLLLSERV
jgi:hypothetical protein